MSPRARIRAKESFGEHHPFCGGSCLVPRTERGDNLILVSMFLIVAPSVIGFVFVTTQFSKPVEIVLDVVLALLLVTALSNLLLAFFTEPGILKTEKNDATGKFMVVRDGTRRELSDFRAKFCRETGNCIENFDHFCPWVGNAIGIRNYSFFFTFVATVVILDLYVDAIGWAAIISNMDDSGWDGFSKSLRHRIGALVVIVYTIIIGFSISPLFFYHIYLISHNMTTNEDLKGRWDAESNALDKGCVINWCNFLKTCGKRRDWVVSMLEREREMIEV